MKKIISLVKVLFKSNLNWSEGQKKSTKVILFILLGAYMLFVFSNFWNLFIEPLKEINKGEDSIYLILNVSSALIFMTSITYIINILYFTNDMENILPFPFKPREVFAAKLIVAYIYEFAITIMITLPGFIMYGVSLQKGFLYYIYAILILVLIPIIPIALLTFVYTILMQLFKMTKYKNFFKVITTVLVLTTVVVFQMKLNENMLDNGNYSSEYIEELCDGFKEHSPYYIKVATDSIQNIENISGVFSLLWFIIMNAISITVLVFGLDNLFLKGMLNAGGGGSFNKITGKINYKLVGKFNTIVRKDLKSLFRNVTFFIQCVLPTSFMPAFILFSVISSSTINEINLNVSIVVKILFGILIIQFFMIMNEISATAISRDGEYEITYMKTLPVSIRKQIDAKVMPSIYVGLFNLLVSMIFNIIIFSFSIKDAIILTIIGVLLNFVQSYAFIILDIKKPKLEVDSDMSIVKHNMNVLKAIGIWFAVIIFTAILGNIFIIFNLSYFEYVFLLLLILVLYLLKSYVNKNVEKEFEKIY